jgi:Holliday junction resolvasome RuvABC endonuclease subunit
MSKAIKVVGIDPSLNNFGIACASVDLDTHVITLDKVDLFHPPEADKETKKKVRKNSDDLRRAKWLQERLIEACKSASLAVVEMPIGSQSARAMASYGIVIGVLSSCPIPMIEVTPIEVKLAGVGTKTASKEEMIEWATKKHPEANWFKHKSKGVMVVTSKNEHCADATAALYAALKTAEFRAMLEAYKMFKGREETQVA